MSYEVVVNLTINKKIFLWLKCSFAMVVNNFRFVRAKKPF